MTKQHRDRIVSVEGLRPVISRSSQMKGAVLRVRAIGRVEGGCGDGVGVGSVVQGMVQCWEMV